jgi:hypothetical protein
MELLNLSNQGKGQNSLHYEFPQMQNPYSVTKLTLVLEPEQQMSPKSILTLSFPKSTALFPFRSVLCLFRSSTRLTHTFPESFFFLSFNCISFSQSYGFCEELVYGFLLSAL